MPNVGPIELIIVLVIALIIFGPKRLPEMGRSIGTGIREFKGSVTAQVEPSRTPASAQVEAGRVPVEEE